MARESNFSLFWQILEVNHFDKITATVVVYLDDDDDDDDADERYIGIGTSYQESDEGQGYITIVILAKFMVGQKVKGILFCRWKLYAT